MITKSIENIKLTTDLIALIEDDLGPGKKSGSWTMFVCPFHKDKTPSLGACNPTHQRHGFWKCFGCGKGGDVYSWLQEYRGLDFNKAVKYLGGDLSLQSDHQWAGSYAPPKEAPGQDWQKSAGIIVSECRDQLWKTEDGLKALKWLKARGLKDNTIRSWDLGFSDGRKIAGLWVEHGIILPCWAHGRWWYIKTRRPKGDPKYIKVKGSSGAALWGLNAPWATEAFRVEGEFDQMLLWQETFDLTNCFTFGSATDRLDIKTWARDFLEFKEIIDAGDNDLAGILGSNDWIIKSGRVVRAELPSPAKDITDYWKQGGNVRAWAIYQLKRAGL